MSASLQMHLKRPEKPRSLRRASPSRAQPNDELPAVWRAVRRRARYAAGGGGGGFGGLGGGMSNSFPVRAAPSGGVQIVVSYQKGCTVPFGENLRKISKDIQVGL